MFYLWIFATVGINGKGYYLPTQSNWSGTIEIPGDMLGTGTALLIPLKAENGKWVIELPAGYRWKSSEDQAQILEDDLRLEMEGSGLGLVIVASRCTRAQTVMKKYCWPAERITIGKADDSLIEYSAKMVSRRHGTLYSDGQFIRYEDHSTNGTWVNGRRVSAGTITLRPGDHLDIAPMLRIFVFKDFFALNSLEKVQLHQNLQVFDPQAIVRGNPPADLSVIREYHRAPRQIQQMNTDPVQIDPPLEKNRDRKIPDWLSIGPSMTMILPMLVSSVVMGRNMGASLVMIGTSSALSVMWATLNRRYDKREKLASEQNRQNICKHYYAEIEELLSAMTDRERKRLNNNYPSSAECAQLPFANNHRMWERLPQHADFLQIRIGVGEQELPNPIAVQKLKINMVDDPLRHEPQRLLDQYHMMRNVPVIANLREHQIVGVLGNKNSPWMLQSMIVQLAANHSYHDVRIAVIHDEVNKAQWKFTKRLPHTYASDDRTLRLSVCGSSAVQEALKHLDGILTARADLLADENRKDSEGAVMQIPWYVIFVTSPALLEDQAIMRFLNTPNLGYTIVMQANDMEELPKECGLIIEARTDKGTIYHTNGEMTGVAYEAIDTEQLRRFADGIAPYRIKELTGDSSIPNLVTFLESYGVRSVDEIDIRRKWSENHAWLNVRSVLGYKAGSQPFVLDISDKNHGPHGLIAGTTGAGKSVLLQSFILSLAINYSPEEIQFVLIDYKGGGTSEDFRGLPHTAGVIDSLQGQNYILRALASIKGEIKRRETLFKEAGVNNIDDYMKLFNPDPREESLGHLIIIVDEFAELKSEQPEFMHELVSAARVGRSLGMHLVLATQKPSGSVSDEIDANSRFRICLRVASRGDSMEMLKRPEAAYLKGMGRCYVKVGNDELFEQVQTSWSGSPYDPNALHPEEEPRILNEAGQPMKFRKKSSDSQSDKRKTSELQAVLAYLDQCCKRYDFAPAKQLWLEEMAPGFLLKDLPFYGDMHWDGKAWPTSEPVQKLSVLFGIADDVSRQQRLPAEIDFYQDHNVIISGLSGSGKTTMLQTLALSLALSYSPAQLNLYVFSLSSRMLQCLEHLPHVGEIVYGDEPFEQGRLLELLHAETIRRKKLFSQMATDNFTQYNKAAGRDARTPALAAIVVLVDGLSYLRELNEEKLKLFYAMLGSAAGQGVYFVLSGLKRNELPAKYDSFVSGFTLQQPDRPAYAEALGCKIPMDWAGIREYPGRGVLKQEDKDAKAVYVFETQVAAYGPLDSDAERASAIRELGAEMRRAWTGPLPAGIGRVPAKPTMDMMLKTPMGKKGLADPNLLPIGYDKKDGAIHCLDLRHFYSGLIHGISRKGGKTNTIKVMAETFRRKGATVHVVGSSALAEWARTQGMNGYSIGGPEWAEAFDQIFALVGKRSNLLMIAGKQSQEKKNEVSATFERVVILVDDLDKYIDAYSKDQPKLCDNLYHFVLDNEKIATYRVNTFCSVSTKGYNSFRNKKPLDALCGTRRGLMLGCNMSDCDPFGISMQMSLTQKKTVLPQGEALLVGEDDYLTLKMPLYEKPADD